MEWLISEVKDEAGTAEQRDRRQAPSAICGPCWKVPTLLPSAHTTRRLACRIRACPFVVWLNVETFHQPNSKEDTMRFMILVKATQDSEAGAMPDQQLLAEMGRYNEELVKAGVMLAGEGLHPSSKGKRVRFSGKQRSVTDGPFAETKELVAGFWIWQCASMEEAVEWVKRCPNPMPGESEIEIRQVFEAEDFGKEFTPELRDQEERLRAEIAKKSAGKA
jgi:hypothetical protein